MFNDVLNFLRFQTQDIEHYNQYSIALILFIIVVLEIPSPMLYGGYDMGGVFDIVIDMVFAILFVVITARFLVYWFARKNIQHSFPTVLNFFGVLSIVVSIVGIVFGIIVSIFSTISSMAALTCFILAALYSFCVATITTSEATTAINAAGYTEGITKAYAFSGILIATIITLIITTAVISLF